MSRDGAGQEEAYLLEFLDQTCQPLHVTRVTVKVSTVFILYSPCLISLLRTS